MRIAGHPSPLIVGHEDILAIPEGQRGPLLGVFEDARWPPVEITLGSTWTLVVYTDGIIEGHAGDGTERFDSAMLARVAAEAGPTQSPRELADTLVEAAEKANGEPLKDDVALVILAASPPGSR
jgi:serine phosphatase RsbU (regulator of sigma subunit)